MDTGPQNAVISDVPDVEIPQTTVQPEDLALEKNMAKFSKTKEYQKLKEHLQGRITYFQNFLPDGTSIALQKVEEKTQNWIIANIIIGEFKAVLNAYEQANEVVENVSRATSGL